MSTKEEREFKLGLLRGRLAELTEQIAPLEERCRYVRGLIDKLLAEDRQETSLAMISAPFEEQAPYYLNFENYRHDYYAFDAFFEKMGLSTNGYNRDTNQIQILLKMNQDKTNWGPVLSSLEKIEPFIEKNKSGHKVFHVFTLKDDHTCHLIKLKREWVLYSGWYDPRNSPIGWYKRSTSLKNILAYMCENHYFTPIETESEED